MLIRSKSTCHKSHSGVTSAEGL